MNLDTSARISSMRQTDVLGPSHTVWESEIGARVAEDLLQPKKTNFKRAVNAQLKNELCQRISHGQKPRGEKRAKPLLLGRNVSGFGAE